MTITEFANKYKLPVTVVYEASFGTETRYKDGKYVGHRIDFPEHELHAAVTELLKRRVDRAQNSVDKNSELLRHLDLIDGTGLTISANDAMRMSAVKISAPDTSIPKIEYTDPNGYTGKLYNPHCSSGKIFYQMSIYDSTGAEVLHSYDAAPTNTAQLMDVVSSFPAAHKKLFAHEEGR